MTGFQADTAKLARHAAEFGTFADRAAAVHGELSAALNAAGPCWGDDPAGRSFAAGHVGAAGSTLDSMRTLPGRLNDVGDRFATTARGYQQADEYSAGQLPD
jgi:hypothetical protein